MALLQHPDAAAAAAWLRAMVRGSLRSDSRLLQPGDGFLAWAGQQADGRRHVAAALRAGAGACLVQAEGVEAQGLPDDARISCLPGLQAGAGEVAAAFFGQPGALLDVIACTGTNGKTSTAWWTAQALTALGRRCGVIGTLGVGEPPAPGAAPDALPQALPGALQATGLTTPDAVMLQAVLHQFVCQGLQACALEASSIGLEQQRLAGAPIRVAVFTNFTQDHLDAHGSMAAYWAAKRRLFSWPGLRAAVVNVDDPQGAQLAVELADAQRTAGAGRGLELWTVGIERPARLQARALRYEGAGLACEVHEGNAPGVALRTSLVGQYNISNLLGVIATLRALGWPLTQACAAVAGVSPVPGRLEPIEPDMPALAAAGLPQVLVDYAHTPDALQQVLNALRPLAAARGGRLWCVFGCGGNRDAGKRPLMGAIAAQTADQVLITSDNPRLEPPGSILAQVLAGVPAALRERVLVLEDRQHAIALAVGAAAAADVLLLAGKGHEDYQDAGGVKRPFADPVVARAALAWRAERAAAVRAAAAPVEAAAC